MSSLQWVLVGLFAVFVLLYLRSPQNPKLAIAYLRWTLLLCFSIVFVAPFLWLLAAAFKDKSVLNEYLFFPPLGSWGKSMNLDNFRRLFAGDEGVSGKVYFWQYILNSTFFATTNTLLQLLFCSAAGFALAKYDFRGKLAILTFMLGSMMVPGVLLFAPVYQMMVNLGLVDTYQGLILPNIVTAYGIFLFRQAAIGVPNEMIDAGRIDGASELRIYFTLVMPLVRPMAAAFCLVTFLSQWNSYFGPSIFLQSQDKLTLPVILNLYIGLYRSDYGIFLAGTLLAIVPPAVLFLVLEKEFVSGLTTGAVKG